jgi:deoxyribonuclease V
MYQIPESTMRYQKLHDWDVSPREAIALQQQLRHQVQTMPLEHPAQLVAGCDISFDRFSEDVHAGIVVIRLPELEIVDSASVTTKARFPYIPGLLSFRETPALLEVWERLQTRPDVVMIDGQGYAHPRRFGFACHFGLLVGVPTLGCAKSLLVGKFENLADAPGSTAPILHQDEVVGMALRTRERVAPVFVSVGHLIDLPSAVSVTLDAARGAAPAARYRIPAPTRFAHLLVNEVRRAAG